MGLGPYKNTVYFHILVQTYTCELQIEPIYFQNFRCFPTSVEHHRTKSQDYCPPENSVTPSILGLNIKHLTLLFSVADTWLFLDSSEADGL